MLLAACGDRSSRDVAAPAAAQQLFGQVCERNSAQLFPDTALEARIRWYGAHFRALGEGRLCHLAPAKTEVYRFVWLRSFHRPVAVRVTHDSGGTSLRAKETDGKGGYEPGRVVTDTTVVLTPAQWQELQALVARTGLWEATPPAVAASVGLDGAQWVIEGVRDGRYRAIDAWSPEPVGPQAPVHTLGVHLLRLAGLLRSRSGELY
ncbi:MAG: hypothetical protein MUD17_13905 [Gemmatimonadaceae bacterium]|nr:hypothetical protein [Gemmatimonadaceae bacterium]